jgi:hypothetical protein
MDGTLTVTKASLVKLLDGVLYPNPDDPGDPGNLWGPCGPVGPVIPGLQHVFAMVLLNPQPLPPQVEAQRSGSIALPWRSALVARAVIDQSVAQYRFAEVMGSGEHSEGAIETIRRHIKEFVDDYCGTGAHRWPLPWPFPLGLDPAELNPIDLLVAGAQFQKAADSVADSPLQADYSAAADRLLKTGMQRLESS